MERLLVGLLVVLAACALEGSTAAAPSELVATSDSATSDSAPTFTTIAALPDRYPVTVADDLGDVSIGSQPVAIISLSPTATEMLFAIGAGDQVLAVDSLSNFPPEAPLDPDLSAWSPSVESIIGMEPDLVVINSDPGDLVAGLNAAGIPVITQLVVADLEGAYHQMEQLGVATNREGEASVLITQMRSDIAEIVASVPNHLVALTYYHELDDTLYSVTSKTFIGQVYSLLGLENIADPADDGSAYGYPQLSAEYLVDADPDFIFLADTRCCSATAESVAERDGWSGLRAVVTDSVVELDDDVTSRWGPRIVDYLQIVANAMMGVEVE